MKPELRLITTRPRALDAQRPTVPLERMAQPPRHRSVVALLLGFVAVVAVTMALCLWIVSLGKGAH